MKLIEKGFLKRNEKVLVISLIIFLVFAFAGAMIAFVSAGDDYGIITRNILNLKETNASVLDSSLDLTIPDETFGFFIHNLTSDLIIIIGGLLFSVISLLVVVYNAIIIGAPFGGDLMFASASILPHGIIEYSASVFALAAAFNITKIEISMIRNRSFKSTLLENKTELKDILAMVIIVVVLLAIAAVIECNVTGLVVKWVYGIGF